MGSFPDALIDPNFLQLCNLRISVSKMLHQYSVSIASVVNVNQIIRLTRKTDAMLEVRIMSSLPCQSIE